ncbi:MAG: hypothetical protein E4H20_02750 [Spirochaetales bacterium]|nr:MAG: hypothetical protein E4H20_02750 [Spirochaetales bacterium]
MERTRNLKADRCIAVAFLCLISLASCRKPPPSFEALLAIIDSGAPDVNLGTFITAADLAGGTEDRLRLLKRAAGRDSVFAADVADAVVSAVPPTEPVALAAFDLFLSAGRFRDAQSLLESGLRYDERPLLYAELIVASCRAGEGLWPPLAGVPYLADATGRPEFLHDGALAALRDGNASAARELLAEAMDRGLTVQNVLLWDAGLLDRLALISMENNEPESMELAAGAAYLSGFQALAAQTYGRIIELYPDYSWRPWAALARLGIAEPPAEYADPLTGRGRSEGDGSAGPPGRAALYDSMMARFGDVPDAAREYARWLLESDDDTGARHILASLTEKNASEAGRNASLRALVEPARAPVLAIRLVTDWADSPEAVDTALAMLFSTGAWDDYLRLRSRIAGMNDTLPRSWFWKAADALFKGEPEKAIPLLMAAEVDRDDYSAAYALGLAALSAGRPKDAAAAFRTAASKPVSPSRQALALSRAGDALRFSALPEEALAMYRAALSVDQSCLSARVGMGALDAASP